ncbi:MAG: hypothetical protein WC686_05390 [Candidatus Shapirobacteria bacterium]|jgi:hypothetical protein
MNLLRPIIAILILFIPLYPKFPLTSVTGTYVSVRLDDYVVAASILLWLIYQFTHRFPVLKHRITPLFIAYFLGLAATTVNAILVYQTTPTNILLLHFLRRFEYMSLFFITIDAIQKEKDLLFPYITLLMAIFGIAAYGYGQKYLNFPIVSTMNSEFSKGILLQMDNWSRISSTFAGHYDLAAYLSLIIILLTTVIILTPNLYLKFFSVIAWGISFHLLSLTASRISVIAFWFSSILTLVLIRKYLWILPISVLVIFTITNSKDLNQRLLATIPAIKLQLNKKPTTIPTPTVIPTPLPTLAFIPTPKPILAPVFTPTPTPTIFRHQPIDDYPLVDADVGVARSGEIRFNAEWPRAITAFTKNKIFGTGLGSITLATDNDYLRLLGESGIVGFVSFIAILVYFFINSLKFAAKKQQTFYDKLALTCLGGLVCIMANALFIDVFEASKTAYTYWLFLGVYYRLIHYAQPKTKI